MLLHLIIAVITESLIYIILFLSLILDFFMTLSYISSEMNSILL